LVVVRAGEFAEAEREMRVHGRLTRLHLDKHLQQPVEIGSRE
jgi:hypothetical protein